MKKIGKRIASFFKERHFLKSVLTLVSGTVLGQAVTLASLPILTRIYSPDDFGVLALFTSCALIVSTAACLRLDVAIPTATKHNEARDLLLLAVTFAAIISIVTFLVLLLIPESVILNYGVDQPLLYISILAFAIFFSSTYNAFQFWATRAKKFGIVARTRVTQSVYGAVVQVLSGIAWGGNPLGLVVGQVISTSGGVLKIYREVIRGSVELKGVTISGLRRTLESYKNYPKYSTAESFFNSAAIQLPILIVSAAYLGAEAGFIMLAMRVMQVPMRLVGSSIGQVYLSEAPSKNNAGELAEFSLSVISALARTGVGPIVFFGIVAPSFFAPVFGPDWERAGTLIAWMTPWFVLQFITSPVAMSLHISGHQRAALKLQVLGFAIRVSFVLFGLFVLNGWVSELYSISGFLFYLIYFVVIVLKLGVSLRTVLIRLASSVVIVIGWAVVGFILVLVSDEVFH